MWDKNFFEPYIGSKEKKNEKQKIMIMVPAIIGALLVSYTLFTVVRGVILDRQIAKVDSELSENDLIEKKESVENKKIILEELQQIDTELNYVSLDLNEKDKLGSYLLETITNSMPSEIFLKSITLNHEVITIEGISRTKEDIAKLEANLRQVIYLQNVFIPAIGSEEGFYTFNITTNLSAEGLEEQEKSTQEQKENDAKDEKKEDTKDEKKEDEALEEKDKEDDKDETKR